MRILDRYILRSFLVNYLLAFGVLVGMFILLDLIVNVQDFARGAAPGAKAAASSAWTIASDMADYYSYQLLLIFQYVSGVIPLLAAGFTMVRMTRHHELTAMIASGVSLYRVAAPIVLISIAFSALHVINQEFVISRPFIIEKLLRKHDEVRTASSRTEPLLFIKDSDGSLLSARDYDPVARRMTDVFIVERDARGMPLRHTVAASAAWEVPPGSDLPVKQWVLREVVTEDDTGVNPFAQRLPWQVRHTGLTPEQIDLILSRKAVDFLSSARVSELARFSPEVNRHLLYKIMHIRFTQPLMNIILLLIGIPFLLTREPNRLVVNMFYCIAVIGFVFAATFIMFEMGGKQLPSLLGAWLPVLIFAPLAFVMTDLIQT